MAILSTRTSRDAAIMLLLRSLLHVAAQFSFFFSAEHVAEADNGVADALSRFYIQVSRSLAPNANKHPSKIPVQLLSSLSPVV